MQQANNLPAVNTGSQQLQKEKEAPAAMKAFFESEGVRKKFEAILGKRASAFLTSLLQVANGNDKLLACEPRSLMNAAMIAATLDLPINPNLGFAWIVPYKGAAQFQMGYKGFIQLAQRSGQYARITAAPIFANQFISWDMITEDLKVNSLVKGEGEVAGYMAFFRLINGFEKVMYWTKAEVEAHAKRYSQGYQSGYNTNPWKTDFDKMAMKTVLKALLSTWGILSVEMQKGLDVDQAVILDEEGNRIRYVDNEEKSREEKAAGVADSTLQAMKEITANASGNAE